MKKVMFLSCYLFFYSLSSFCQDSIPAVKDLSEEKELMFQPSFFKALTEKSIGNYQKAIENLEDCNQVLPNNVAVFFEFSKNYLLLNNTLLAKEYINRAIVKEPKNSWLLKHLVKVQIRERKFSEAIKTQQKVVALNPKERGYLVRLYLQNKEPKKAIVLLHILEKENLLSPYLRNLQVSLRKKKADKIGKETSNTTTEKLIQQFKTDKSYKLLVQIVQQSSKNTERLLKYSQEGIALFPAQPFVYFINGKALNTKKKYKKALEILQNGLDFVFKDAMEANFYKEMALSYKGLGNKKKEQKFLKKYKKLK
ncbi:MAG: tetratricopeptide repeat protein [Polaribacter sp.]